MTNKNRPTLSNVVPLFLNGKFSVTANINRIHDSEEKLVNKIAEATPGHVAKAAAVAKEALSVWTSLHAIERGRHLYNLAEALELRHHDLVLTLESEGEFDEERAEEEVLTSIERTFWYAGWCDKIPQVYSSANPVNGPYANVTSVEPMGVIGVFAPKSSPVAGIITALLPLLAGGNTVVLITNENAKPECTQPLLQAIHSAELPKGVVNILHGKQAELVEAVAGSADIEGLALHNQKSEFVESVRSIASKSLKYIEIYDDSDARHLYSEKSQSPYRILPFVEFKTVWHPAT